MSATLKYGPQTAEIGAFLERARTLTIEEVRALSAGWKMGTDPSAALDAALSAVQDAGRLAKWDEVWYAVRDAMWSPEFKSELGAAWYWAWYAVRNAAYALSARDLITPDGFTWAHYYLLAGPWQRVAGEFITPESIDVITSNGWVPLYLDGRTVIGRAQVRGNIAEVVIDDEVAHELFVYSLNGLSIAYRPLIETESPA